MHLFESNYVTIDRLLISYPTLFFVPTALAAPQPFLTCCLLFLALSKPRWVNGNKIGTVRCQIILKYETRSKATRHNKLTFCWAYCVTTWALRLHGKLSYVAERQQLTNLKDRRYMHPFHLHGKYLTIHINTFRNIYKVHIRNLRRMFKGIFGGCKIIENTSLTNH